MAEHEIYLDRHLREIWLRQSRADTWTQVVFKEREVRFRREAGRRPSKSAIALPSALLMLVGLVPPELLVHAEEKEGTYPHERVGDLLQKYFLFFCMSQQTLFLLQQNVPGVPQQIRGSNMLAAQYLDRIGRCFRVVDGKLETREGTILVPRGDSIVPIPLELLRAAGLTTEELVSSVGGPYLFTPNRRFRPEDW